MIRTTNPDIIDEIILAMRTSEPMPIPPPSLRRHIREAAGISREAAARAIGITGLTLFRWEMEDRTPQKRFVRVYGTFLETCTARIQRIRATEIQVEMSTDKILDTMWRASQDLPRPYAEILERAMDDVEREWAVVDGCLKSTS